MMTTYWIKGFLRMFYISSPTAYNDENSLYLFEEAWPFFVLFIIVENIVLFLRNLPMVRLNDGITSLAHFILYEFGRITFKGAENFMYCYIYNNFKLFELESNSVVVWYGIAVAVDFCYYWAHRASHVSSPNQQNPEISSSSGISVNGYYYVKKSVEVHILWAQHQVHHSSEDFNLFIGLRHSFLNSFSSAIFYLPLAFFVPPVQLIVHQQFSLLYQFWLHTETVKSLGPLEYILNTPMHHKVHHGSNIMYLDKNYGGFLIIWDRLFGTFAKLNKSQIITYGLVLQPSSFNPLYLQVFYNQNVIKKWNQMNGFVNKIQSVLKGPSWTPGSKWTGSDDNKLNVQFRKKYNNELTLWMGAYLAIHFCLVLLFFAVYMLTATEQPLKTLSAMLYILCSLSVIGMFFDEHKNSTLFETIRCITGYLLVRYIFADSLLISVIYITSTVFWILKLCI